ncbi:DUF4850 domain-containing protein [Acinetobacter shaoyimingii]|nr:DUF4850 domain-containing protein [Acinetobacter shaoyimingii]
MLKMKILLLSLLCLLNTLTFAKVETFNPKFSKFSDNAIQRKKWNQFYSIGYATFNNNVQVPIYGVTVENPYDDGILKESKPCTKNTCTFNFKLDPQQASQIKVIVLPNIGAVMIPRAWTDISASAGANGSGSALIMSADQKEQINLYNSAFCVGCGMPYASLYFPHLLKQSVENEFGGYVDKNKKLNVVYPSKNVAFFSYQIPNLNNKTHGIAKYDDEDTFNFQEISTTLDQSNQNLARPILNFYHAMH